MKVVKMQLRNWKRILKFSVILLILLSVVGNTRFSLCQEKARSFSRAKILSINPADSTIKIIHFIGVERNYYTLKIQDTTVIKKGEASLKLSELKAQDKVSITYTKDKDGNKIATSISLLSSD